MIKAGETILAEDFTNNIGDGSDGDVTISSPTTLTRNMFYNNLTVNDVLTTNGFKIFVKGTISGTGTIKYPTGNAASGQTAGAAFSGASYGFVNIAGVDGANAATSANGNNGNAGNAASTSIGVNGVAGGAGGNGTSGKTGGLGGIAGVATAILTKLIYRLFIFLGLDWSPTTLAFVGKYYSSAGSGSGGSGGSGGAFPSAVGGGSGATGGIVFIAARIWSGTFTIQAVGGAGGNGANSSSPENGSGGGGSGGNGGNAIILYHVKTWTGSYNLAGGAKGLKGTGGANNGFDGNDGTTGTYYEIKIFDLI